ncbi:IFT81-CH domain-containing protein [Aphelenchoides besseyi]|nr:IFT81-CH domain-containing protein [Aphelenchoides besseyi]
MGKKTSAEAPSASKGNDGEHVNIDCWHGLLPNEDTGSLLKNDGDFFVYNAAIIPAKRGGYEFKDNIFETIKDIIDFYQVRKRPLTISGVTTTLETPIRRKSWELRHRMVTLGKELGSGSYGTVYRGTLQIERQKPIEVAVKVLTEMSAENSAALWKEARNHQSFDHQNVVRITIVDGLNSPPFNLNITIITFDSMNADKLLQVLSDVLCWIQGTDKIDIRSETPDETAMRILNTLRILKYPPPRGIDQILKERVYLAKYLTKIEIPHDIQTPELMQTIHSRIIDIRSDFVRAADVKTDLKTMKEEKDQLIRKLERSKFRIGDRLPDIKRYLDLAAQYRRELEKQQELIAQKQEQKDAIEAETNRYIVYEKLPKDIANLKTNIESVRKILSMRTVTTQDIAGIKQKIEDLNKEVMDMTLQRDKKDETAEDKLSIYRHQAASVQRKKSSVAEQLQQLRQQSEYLENRVSQKKRELGLKNGGEELYKNYVNKMRLKTNLYKRKKLEMDQLNCEVSVLRSTREILQNNWETLKKEIQSEGRGVIGDAEMQAQRPQTAKPTTTDISNLKHLVKGLGDQLTVKRQDVARLNEEITEFSQQQKKNVENADGVDVVVEKLEKNNSECLSDIGRIRSELKDLLQRSDAAEQIEMWKSLVLLFQKKIDLHKQKLNGATDRPIGDAH